MGARLFQGTVVPAESSYRLDRPDTNLVTVSSPPSEGHERVAGDHDQLLIMCDFNKCELLLLLLLLLQTYLCYVY